MKTTKTQSNENNDRALTKPDLHVLYQQDLLL